MLGGDGGHPSLRRRRQTDLSSRPALWVQSLPSEFLNGQRNLIWKEKKCCEVISRTRGGPGSLTVGDGAVLETWDAVRSSLGLGEDRGVWLGGGAVLETVRWHSNMKSPDTTEVSSFLCILCASFARMYICAPHICLMPMEARSRGWIPWEQNYRWLWTTMLALGIEHKFSGRAVSP